MSESKRPLIDRRRVFAGAGTVGALAAAAAVLPALKASEPVVVAKTDAVESSGGYQLTEHVKRYYETTRI